MYAVVEVAGCQFRVETDQVIRVPLLSAAEGDTVVLDQVLMVKSGETVKVGKPTVSGATVSAQVVGHGRTPKLKCGWYIRRKDHHRTWGHRQDYTDIRIAGIQG